MTTQYEDQDGFTTLCFDPFPEPQTIPSGWDMSEFLSAPKADSVSEAGDSADDES